MRHIITAALATALALPAAAANPHYVSWQGTWHLNKTETHYPPGVMVTANDLVVSQDDGKALKFTETVTNAGNTTTQTFDGAYDGKPVDLGGGEALSFKHRSATSYLAIRHNKDGFLLERTIFVLSHRGEKLTCHVFAQQPGGKPIKFDEIFDKEG